MNHPNFVRNCRRAVYAALLLMPPGTVGAGWRNGTAPDLVAGNQLVDSYILNKPQCVITGPGGVVFVSDTENNRVLRFSSSAAATGGQPAGAVFGQPDMSSVEGRNINVRLSAPMQICLDGAGNLWVADSGNHRVLRYANALTVSGSAPAVQVLGKPNFEFVDGDGPDADLLLKPHGVAVDLQGNLYVADTGRARVMIFLNAAAKPSGGSADKVLGQSVFTDSERRGGKAGMDEPYAVAVENYGGGKVRLWMADRPNCRVMRWDDVLNKADGADADGVLGQSNFEKVSPNHAPGGLGYPTGLAVESPGRLWVVNGGGGKVYRYENAALLPDGAQPAGILQTTGPAAVAPDGSGGLWAARPGYGQVSYYPGVSQAAGEVNPARSLGGQESHLPEGDRAIPDGVAVDPVTQKLFVSEPGNNRVLRYSSVAALHSGEQPEAVLGQTSLLLTSGDSGPARLRKPGQLAFTPAGSLWVADSGNNRVLRFDNAGTVPSGTAASFVIGKKDFKDFSSTPATSSTLYNPYGVCADAASLWVSDVAHHRVLRFDGVHTPVLAPDGKLPGAYEASRVYGQEGFALSEPGLSNRRLNSPQSIALDAEGRLWVADRSNNRVLCWPANAPAFGSAVKVLGQAKFTTGDPWTGTGNLYAPQGVAVDSRGRLWVGDSANNRILRWDNAAMKADGAPASGVLGQETPADQTTAGCGLRRLNQVTGLCVDKADRLYAADSCNFRVVRYSPVAPNIVSVTRMEGPGTVMALTFRGEPNMLHRVQASQDLQSWFTVKDVTTGQVGAGSVTVSSQLKTMFFRIVEP